MTFQKTQILVFTFLIDPLWLHTEVYSEFKKVIQNLPYLNKNEIQPFLKAKTFKEILVSEKNIENMSLCMLLGHLTNGCFSLHQGLRKDKFINLHIKIEIFQESPNTTIKYKSLKCSEKEINKREYYLYKDLEIIRNLYDKSRL